MFLLTKTPYFSFVYVFYAPVITKKQDDFQDGRRNNDIENCLNCLVFEFTLLC